MGGRLNGHRRPRLGPIQDPESCSPQPKWGEEKLELAWKAERLLALYCTVVPAVSKRMGTAGFMQG